MSTREQLSVKVQAGTCEHCNRRYPMIRLANGATVLIQPVAINPIQPVIEQKDVRPTLFAADSTPMGTQIDVDKVLNEVLNGIRPGIQVAPVFVLHDDVCHRKAQKQRKSRPDLLQDVDQRKVQRNKVARFGHPGDTEGAN